MAEEEVDVEDISLLIEAESEAINLMEVIIVINNTIITHIPALIL